MLKITRLFRLSKIVTYIKMSKSFKHGARLILLFLYLILMVHWLACSAYYLYMQESVWLPPVNIIPEYTIIYTDYT